MRNREVYNEHIKLLSGFINALALAFLVVGLIDTTEGVQIVAHPLYIITGVAVHIFAHAITSLHAVID